MLESLGPDRLRVSLAGDGAGSMVQALATTGPGAQLQVLAWNGTLDQTKQDGEPLLGRRTRLLVDGLAPGNYQVSHRRLDIEHSNIATHWRRLGSPDWPDQAGWERLRAADRLESLKTPSLTCSAGQGVLEFDLPMPGVSLLRLQPAD